MNREQASAEFFCTQGNGYLRPDWRNPVLLDVKNNTITAPYLLQPDGVPMRPDCLIEIIHRAGREVISVRNRSGD